MARKSLGAISFLSLAMSMPALAQSWRHRHRGQPRRPRPRRLYARTVSRLPRRAASPRNNNGPTGPSATNGRRTRAVSIRPFEAQIQGGYTSTVGNADHELDDGTNIGLGWEIANADGASFFVEARYLQIAPRDYKMQFVAINVGLRF